MERGFAEQLKALRTARGMSQQQLAQKLFVSRSSVTRWENGTRIPNLLQLSRIADFFNVEISELVGDIGEEQAYVIIVDDNKRVLAGGLELLTEVMPGPEIIGFSSASAALRFAENHEVGIAFVDIELGRTNGLKLCQQLLEKNPQTNVIFLTAYPQYALDAWETEASGFLVKPITEEDVRKQLQKLKHPVRNLL